MWKWKQCYPARYQVLYEDLVEEQVHSSLMKMLTEIATKRAEFICEHSLTDIKNDQKSLTSEDEEIQKVWTQISAPDFYSRELQALGDASPAARE